MKTKIDERGLVDRLVEGLSRGMSVKASCAYAGVTEMTYYKWYNKGVDIYESKLKRQWTADDKKYIKFVYLIDQAKGSLLMDLNTVLYQSAVVEQNTEDAKWLLERKDPAFNKIDKMNNKVESRNETTIDLTGLSVEQLKALAGDGDGAE